MKKIEVFIKDIQGMTLMEVILAILLLAIISMAAYGGFRYAYYTLSGAEEFAETAYKRQDSYENALSYALGTYIEDDGNGQLTVYEIDKAKLDTLVGTMTGTDETISFTWTSSTTINDFTATGVIYSEEAVGESYLSDSVYVFIPIRTD